MSVFRVFLVVVMAIGLSSCSNTSHQGTSDQVELNDGKRWKVNEATNVGVENMQRIASAANDLENPDLAMISTDLKTEFDLIFKNCTMTGPGHDQLHNYLLPMLGWMRRMREGNDDEAKQAFDEISAHLNTYGQYFE